MADPPAAAPAGAAMSGQDALLATKLHVPRPQPGFVPRPRLVQALSQGLARGRVLVCAPAGFGKTSLLADWARSGGRPVAWLGLDAGDNDPARFWRYVVAALDQAQPGIAERLGPLLGPPAPRSFDGLVTALINELAAQPGRDEVLLVLDDYHLVDAGPVHESVAFLLENLPPGLLLVVSGRADPPLPLARLRARGQLAELRAAELRFTTEEAAALLGAAAGPDLPDTAVAALTARTEGWAAGLQLAALSLRGRTDPAGFVAAFSGSHRFVLDYLADEVLDGQPGQVRAFLLETSVLERLSGELCDAVTGRSGSQAMLHHIERAGLFLVPLDEVRGWWRYHHLFADLLRARLEQEQPGRVQELHRAAAAWSDEHDLGDDAVRHALAAGDTAWAARLVERYVEYAASPQRGRDPAPVAVRAARGVGARPAAPVPGPGDQRRYQLPGGSGRAAWRMTPSAPSRRAATSRMSRRSPGRWACWPTSPRGSRSCAPCSRVFAVIAARAAGWRPAGPGAIGRAGLADAHSMVRGTWRGRTGCAAGSGKPNATWRRCSRNGGRPVRAFSPCGSAMTWARSSAPGATWMRRSRPTGKRWTPPVRSPASPPIWA